MNFKFPDSYKANRPKPFQWLGKILIKLSGWKIKGQISDLYENKFVAIVVTFLMGCCCWSGSNCCYRFKGIFYW